MNDRELLELAAKAAGAQNISFASGELALYNPFGETGNCFWNPLANDGDALRLAVRLHLLIDIRDDGAHTTILGDYGLNVDELHGEDAAGTTRRAIVRAAAAIGKEM